MFSLFECITRYFSVSLEEIKLIAIVKDTMKIYFCYRLTLL